MSQTYSASHTRASTRVSILLQSLSRATSQIQRPELKQFSCAYNIRAESTSNRCTYPSGAEDEVSQQHRRGEAHRLCSIGPNQQESFAPPTGSRLRVRPEGSCCIWEVGAHVRSSRQRGSMLLRRSGNAEQILSRCQTWRLDERISVCC